MTTPPTPGPTPDSRRRSMVVAAFGTVVEWYDFSIFFYVSASLAATFFDLSLIHISEPTRH